MTMRRFDSRKDPWIVLALGATAFVQGVAALVVAVAPGVPLGVRSTVPLALAAAAALLVWCLAGTSYRLGGGLLVVRSGPFRWSVPVEEIERAARLRSSLAAPALSTERVEIRCSNGRPTLQISPDDPSAFLDALLGANPRIGLSLGPRG